MELQKNSYIHDIKTILTLARQKSYTAINTVMVEAYWKIGERIVLQEQNGKDSKIFYTLCRKLTWSHNRLIMRVENADARKFYLEEASTSNWSVRTLERNEDDNPTIGIILCAEKSETVVRYSAINDNEQMFVAKFMPYLPTEEELKAEIERKKIELQLLENKDKL